MKKLEKTDRMNSCIRWGVSLAILSAAIVLLPAAANAAETESLTVMEGGDQAVTLTAENSWGGQKTKHQLLRYRRTERILSTR